MNEETARGFGQRIKATGERIWLDRNPLKPSDTIIILPDRQGQWLATIEECKSFLEGKESNDQGVEDQ